jgi:hypothetical protein
MKQYLKKTKVLGKKLVSLSPVTTTNVLRSVPESKPVLL